MTIETWLFVTAVVTVMFVVTSLFIFVVDMVLDKFGRGRK